MTASIEDVVQGVLEGLNVGKTPRSRADISRRLVKQLRGCGVIVSRDVGGDGPDGDPEMSVEEAISSLKYLTACQCSPEWVAKGIHDPKFPCRTYRAEFGVIEKAILDLKVDLIEAGQRNAELLARVKLLASRRP